MTTTQTGNDIDTARGLLEGILTRMQIRADITAREEEERIVLDVVCAADEDTERVIGRRGQVVDALQHLVGKMMVKHRPERGKPIIVDTDGYRQRHIERLEGLAARTAERCLERGQPVDLNPMPASDRRVIHMAIARLNGVATRSEGEGDDRHIVVIPSAE